MARTQSEIVVAADADHVMEVIADFAEYPQWATGMQQVEVVSTLPGGRALDVRFVLAVPPIRDEFTLRYEWDESGRLVTWSLSGDAGMLTAMDGSYRLEEIDASRTKVAYALAVDIKVPMLGMLKRKAEKVVIDTALKGLKKRVESRG